MGQHNKQSRSAELLLAICSAPEVDHARRFDALSEGDWRGLLRLARLTRTLPLTAHALHIAGKGDAIPTAIARQWREELRMHAIGVLSQGQYAAQVLGAIELAGFQPIALKGMSLTFRDYPNPSLRPLRDIDLLFAPEDALAAEKFLLSQKGMRRRPGAGNYGLEHGHQLPELEHVESGLVIEIHHAINGRGWAGEAALIDFLRESCEVGHLLRQKILVPSAEANFLHLIEHATLHHLFSNGPLLLSDMYFIATKHVLDWAKILEVAERARLHNAVLLALALAHSCGAQWIPSNILAKVAVPDAFIASAKLALLSGDERARELSLLQRLQPDGAERFRPIVALLRMLRPDANELSRHSGRAPDQIGRWLGYPSWLKEKGSRYFRIARDTEIEDESEQMSKIKSWLESS